MLQEQRVRKRAQCGRGGPGGDGNGTALGRAPAGADSRSGNLADQVDAMGTQAPLASAEALVSGGVANRVERELQRQKNQPAVLRALRVIAAQSVKPGGRIARLFAQQSIQFGDALADPCFEQRKKKFLFIREVGVEGAAGVARGGGDVLETGRLEAVARENARRRGNQLLPRSRGARRLRPAPAASRRPNRRSRAAPPRSLLYLIHTRMYICSSFPGGTQEELSGFGSGHERGSDRERRLAPARESMADRADGDARDVHGGARHFHRQYRLAPHRGELRRQRKRIDLGADELPGVERDYPAAQRLARDSLWPQAFLHVLRGALRGQQFSLRLGADTGNARSLSRAARRGRRRFAAQRAGHSGGHVSAREAGHGFRGVRHGGGGRA